MPGVLIYINKNKNQQMSDLLRKDIKYLVSKALAWINNIYDGEIDGQKCPERLNYP